MKDRKAHENSTMCSGNAEIAEGVLVRVVRETFTTILRQNNPTRKTGNSVKKKKKKSLFVNEKQKGEFLSLKYTIK